MAELGFYHLQTIALETALPQLLDKCLQRDWSVVVEVGDEERLAALDEHLWTFADASFLPHAAQGASHRERQPIWLCTDDANPNGAAARFFVEGALPRNPSDLDPYQRVIVMFDGGRDEAVEKARETWRMLMGSQHVLSYWKQNEEGAWMKAN